ncbi:MAG: efflux RND transporter periplasmic adaptor subunit [Acidobacteria bacterium]|nr:efflux RND transporter periplasmic adaptor subunit [Acidobacteriota bacterium]
MSRAAVLLLGILAGLPATGCRPAPETASAVARQQDFEHRIGADGVLKAARVTPITAPAQIRRRVRIAWLAPDGARVEAGEVVARFDAEEIEERLEEARSDLERNDLERAKSESETRSQMASLEAERRKAELDLDLARRFLKTDDELYSRFEILEDAVDEDLASERSDNARHLEELQRSSSKAGLELLSIDQRKARVDLEQAEEALSALEVRAPHAGILTWARDWSGEMLAVGATAWRGQTLGEIPDLAELQAEVYVLEADAGGVTAGQPAEVVVEAHPERRYAATVVRVDAVARPRVPESPVQYFAATLGLETTDPEVMKPGQRVRASLFLERRDRALVVPRQAVFDEEGGSFVYVLEGGAWRRRAVVLGPASLGLRVIESGIAAGERVALERPGGAPHDADGDGPSPDSAAVVGVLRP